MSHVAAHLLSGEGVFQHGGAVELQGGQCGQSSGQRVGGQAQESQTDPTGLLQAAHQSTATRKHTTSTLVHVNVLERETKQSELCGLYTVHAGATSSV